MMEKSLLGKLVEFKESLLLDEVLEPEGAELRPDRSRAGHGLELRRADAERYAA
jgi:hypothetical protein